MSASSAAQSASTSGFQTNQCSSAIRKQVVKNPETPGDWDDLVRDHLSRSGSGNQLEPELEKSHHRIHLSGLRRWKVGDEQAKGSGLRLEHFLHLRALIQTHNGQWFPLHDLVESKYVDAAEGFLTGWPDFEKYIGQVPVNDPAMDLDSLGAFSGAKRVQNQVLLDPYLRTSQDEGDSFKDSISETPLKKGRPGVDFNTEPTESDAADEQIVNEALISFASALTRRWMIQRTSAPYATDVTPSQGSNAGPTYGWRTAADWTMSRDRFHIRARCRENERVQTSHMAGLKASSKKRTDDFDKLSDGHDYGRILTSETDGSLYSIGRSSTEILAIVEAKKRLRTKNRLPIEWQEAAEILAWLNMRLREEAGANGGTGKGSSTERRGMLKPKPAAGDSLEKSRCLLVAQDREEIYLVIGEWDILYEEYALEGRFSSSTVKLLEKLYAGTSPTGSDAGFLTLHVYGPFGSSSTQSFLSRSPMRGLSKNLLALSLHLSQASCSPLSRRPTPPASIQLPAPRGDPCCADCTCKCHCKPPPGSRSTSKPPPDPPKPPSETGSGGENAPRKASTPEEPRRRTPSAHSGSSSGGPDPTPSKGPRAAGRRPDEIRAASAHARDQQDPGTGPVQVQGQQGSLPVRGRPAAGEQRGGRSESQEQASRSRSRAARAAAAEHQGQGPAPGAASRHPPLPQAPGGSFPAVAGQQRQPPQQQGQQQGQQGQRDPSGQPGQHGSQPQRDPRLAPTGSAPQQQGGAAAHAQPQSQPKMQASGQTEGHRQQQPHYDPSSGPGPSHPTQAGPSSRPSPPRPARIETGGPSGPPRNPGGTPAKRDKHNPLSPKNIFGKFRPNKKDKKRKDEDDKEDEGGDGKK